MSFLLQDLRDAWRSLLKTPTLTVAAVLSLGLGIGANTTVFAWVQGVLLRPVPGALQPDALRAVTLETREGSSRSWSYPNYRDFRQRSTTMQFVAQDDLAMSIAVSGEAERAFGALVSGNYFQVLGVQPAVGRLFTDADDRTPGGHPVAVLSHAYWRRRFSSDPAIVGREVIINNVPVTIVGVAASGFLGSFLGLATAAWLPMAMQPQMTGGDRLDARGSGWMNTLVRLAPGASSEQAQAEATALLAQMVQEHKGSFEGWRVRVVPPWQANWGAPAVLAPILAVLSLVVGLVLLIACANVANLLLARAVGRRRDLAVRLALGAPRSRLIRQLLGEALLLAAAAGIVGVATTYWTYGLLMAFTPPTDIPIDFGLGIDLVTIAYAAGASLLTGLGFGLVPALQMSRPETIHAIREEAGRGASSGRTTHRFRNALVVTQVAVCMVLLIGATLFVRSLQAAQHIAPGFDADNLLVVAVDLTPNGYTPESARQFRRRLGERLDALADVQSHAIARRVPLGLGGSTSSGVSIAGYVAQPNEELTINYSNVSPRYFETMKIPLVQGREFTLADGPESARVLIVNETMAERYWPGRNAMGGRVRMGGEDYAVVGVVRDIKYFSLTERAQPHMYVALDQGQASPAVVHVRSAAAPATVLAAVRGIVRDLDANLPIYDSRTVSEHLQGAVFAQRIGASLLGVMGILAVVLAAVGLYGVVAYAVSQRTQEMGIRMALGASPADVLKLVMRHGLGVALIGVMIGIAVAAAMTGFMQSLLPGIAPRDPATFVAVPLALIAIATVAALIPARRAGRVDPVVALRYE